jgi:hypothetical protein
LARTMTRPSSSLSNAIAGSAAAALLSALALAALPAGSNFAASEQPPRATVRTPAGEQADSV